MQLLSSDVRDAARILAENNLGEIVIESLNEAAPFRLRLVRESAAPRRSAAPAPIDSPSAPVQSTVSTSAIEVHATAVGLFREGKTPVVEGAIVSRKQVLGSVESLKTPNDIFAPADGRISAVHAAEGQGVEYGQLLFTIEPAS
ncbi:MAG TPA: acetyl-CoA carboxylase biotin carboxyl carrier protein subunit [Abditibacteriaceae bacterium]|jgi:biotin carboxyl carrier protein